MERITYRKTLDVHKNGVQFLLQGFETADKLSRVIEICLMASGDAIDFPLEDVVVMMYVTTENATEPSIHPCTIKDNKVVYEVLPITEEGITTMQMKIIETDKDGAKSVLAAPKFAVEVTKSNTNDDGEELKASFTAIEEFIAKADTAYGNRLERIELDSECLFKAYYADGTVYETDCLKILFHEGNSVLSESFAKGDTGVRAGEDTDNAKYYSNVARSESLKSKDIMENSETILEEVRLHGVYTAFSVDFESGEVVYVSPTFKFKLNTESGELEASGQNYTFNDDAGKFVEEWLIANGVVLTDLQTLADDVHNLKIRITPIEKGGTGADNTIDARTNLDVYSKDEVSAENTLGLFGLSAENKPNTIFTMLGSHWWRRAVVEEGYSIRESDPIDVNFVFNHNSNTYILIYYSDTIEIKNDKIALVDANQYSIKKDDYVAYVQHNITIPGKYIVYEDGIIDVDNLDYVYRNEKNDWNYSASRSGTGVTEADGMLFSNLVRCESVYYKLNRDVEYVNSTEQDKYPSGREDIFEYEYLGVPFENARSGAKINIGSYVGNGGHGSGNPNKLNFNFTPKVVFLSSDVGDNTMFFYGINNGSPIQVNSNTPNTLNWEEKSLQWYSDNEYNQGNVSGRTYYWVAIG